jgi:hypothetical protein
VRGLYHTFPPLDPAVYVQPQLKPSHGICSFTTTTFGAHRGAYQGAGRSTSGRDLLHLLRGSPSAPPPSAADLLQLPGQTSARPGWHTAVPDLHRHLQVGTQFHPAGIFMSRTAYMGLGSTSAFPGPAYDFSGRNIFFPGRYSRSRAGMVQSRPLLAGIAGFRANPGQFRVGLCSRIPVGPTTGESRLGRYGAHPAWAGFSNSGRARSSSSGWAVSSFGSAGPSRLLRFSSVGLPWPLPGPVALAAPGFCWQAPGPRLGRSAGAAANSPGRPPRQLGLAAASQSGQAGIPVGYAGAGHAGSCWQATFNPAKPASVPATSLRNKNQLSATSLSF